MKSVAELREWRAGAEEEFGDASAVVCQLFFRWSPLGKSHNGELICCPVERQPGHVAIAIEDGTGFVLPIVNGTPKCFLDEVDAYGLERVVPGVWSMSPSLNAAGLVHAFVVLYDVPDPAPWEKRVILTP